MADVSVRPARPEDAERVARVQLSTWRQAYADLLPAHVLAGPEVEVAAVWLHAVEAPPSPRHRVLVAMERAELVGFLASGPATDDDADPDTTVEVSALLVEPRWGRRGHASRLLAAAVEHWRGDGTTTATAWLWERDRSSADFLTAAGWRADGSGRRLDTGERVEPQVRFHVDVREQG